MNLTEDVYKTVLTNLCDGVRLIDNDKKVVYWNKGAEVITGYDAEYMLGRKCTDSLHILYGNDKLNLCRDVCTNSNGRCAAPGEENALIRHKEGYFVPVIICVFPICDDNGNVTGTAEMFNDITWKVAAIDRIEELNKVTIVDSLTGINNRRYAEATLNSKIEELRRFDMPFAVAYLDVDNFKSINDSYGHNTGDSILKIVTKSLSAGLRKYDSICRMGGDEFLIILSNLYNYETLTMLSKRFLEVVNNSTLHVDDEEVQATVSIGSTLARSSDTPESLIARADGLMYRSKRQGKNRINVE